MEQLSSRMIQKKEQPIKVVQFGEGNFLRGFVDYMIDMANEQGIFNGGVAIVKPIPFGTLDAFRKQDNLYTLILRGVENGQTVEQTRIIQSVQKTVDCYQEYEEYMALARLDSLEFIVSNTTEAGIVLDKEDKLELKPQNSYPGKLTAFLYERYRYFKGDRSKGVIVLPVELIEANGKKLKECVFSLCEIWNMEQDFRDWLSEAVIFCSTLVDRIVSGYPRDTAEELWQKLGYEDRLLDVAEPFALWVIESDKDISERFPLDKAGMKIIFTKDMTPFRTRKVRILNGAHTSTVLGAYLAGKDIVLECMQDAVIRKFMETVMFDEIAPTVALPREEVLQFANSVLERFDNPFIKHSLLSISLNSVSKWKSRILPSFKDSYAATGKLPKLLTFSFAALLCFYCSTDRKADYLAGNRNGQEYKIMDDQDILDFFAKAAALEPMEYVRTVASHTAFWGEDLTAYHGFTETVAAYIEKVRAVGMRKVLEDLTA